MKVYVLIILIAGKLRASEVVGVYHNFESAKLKLKKLIGEEVDIYEDSKFIDVIDDNEFLEVVDDYVIYRIQPIETQD